MLKVCLSGDGYTEKHFATLASNQFEITHLPGLLTQATLQDIIPQYDAYVLGGDERFNEQELQLAKKLRVISFVGTGYTSFIDEVSAQKHQVAIKNTPAVMAPAVAEHTIGMLIGLQRKLFEQNWQVKHSAITPCRTQELSALTVGIVGLGEIGTRIARILRQSFGSKVVYVSRTRKPSVEAELNISSLSLDTLFSTADVIILSLPTNAETEYFINDALLAKLKEGVILINTAGARLIEPGALKKYLENGKIAAAALDGYYIEPLPTVSEDPFQLLAMPDSKLIITPHTAAKTTQSWERMIDMAINNVIQYFDERLYACEK